MTKRHIIFQFLMISIFFLLFTDNMVAEEIKLPLSNPAIGDSFGYSVAIDGDYAIVGSPSKDSSGLGSDVGKAYIYVRSGNAWSIQDSLIASDASAGDNFGYSVDIDGDYVIVGAPLWDSTAAIDDVGKAYIFTRSGTSWSEQAVLRPHDPKRWQYFGWSVAIEGEYAIIGAYKDDEIAANAGAAYVFLRTGSNWSEQAKLLGSEHEQNDRFGQSVSISGNTVLVAAYYDDGEEPDFEGGGFNPERRNSGAAYVFTRSGSIWSEQYILRPPDPVETGFFGFSNSIENDRVVIGAPLADGDGTGPQAGSAYIYERSGSTWDLDTLLTASDAASYSLFAYSVSLNNNFCLIGSPKDDFPGEGTDIGSAYSFLFSGGIWTEKAKIFASDRSSFDQFGYSLAIDGDYAIVGNPAPPENDSSPSTSPGAAYIYHSIDDLALPVTLLSFEAVANNNSILLKWTTASEIENQGFILKRSIEEDNNFLTIASYLNDPSLVGAGNSSSQNEYSFEDNSIDQDKTYIYNLFSVSINGEIKDIGQVQLGFSETNYPDNIVLYSNYPNPFNPITNFRIYIPENIKEPLNYELTIFNSLGQKVKSIPMDNVSPGMHNFEWKGMSDNGTKVPSGTYFAVLKYGTKQQVIRMSLIK